MTGTFQEAEHWSLVGYHFPFRWGLE